MVCSCRFRLRRLPCTQLSGETPTRTPLCSLAPGCCRQSSDAGFRICKGGLVAKCLAAQLLLLLHQPLSMQSSNWQGTRCGKPSGLCDCSWKEAWSCSWVGRLGTCCCSSSALRLFRALEQRKPSSAQHQHHSEQVKLQPLLGAPIMMLCPDSESLSCKSGAAGSALPDPALRDPALDCSQLEQLNAVASAAPGLTLHVKLLAQQGLLCPPLQQVQVCVHQVCAGVPVAQQPEAGGSWASHQAPVGPRQAGQGVVLDCMGGWALQGDALLLSQLEVHLWQELLEAACQAQAGCSSKLRGKRLQGPRRAHASDSRLLAAGFKVGSWHEQDLLSDL